MRITLIFNEALPLFFLAFMLNVLSFLNVSMVVNLRWITSGLLFFYLILRRRLLVFLDPFFFFVLFIYFSWCFFTSFWSEMFLLSFAKSSLFALVALAAISAGIEWIRTHSIQQRLNYLAPVALLSLSAGFFGLLMDGITKVNTNLFALQGFIHGANMFGAMLAMTFPFLLWKTYLSWKLKRHFFAWSLLLGSCLLFLFLSLSRSSLLCMLFSVMGFSAGLTFEKKISLLLASILIGVGLLLTHPMTLTHWIQTYVYKTTLQKNQTLFYTRSENWVDSFIAAKEGGWIGLGFGVSYGSNEFNLTPHLTAVGYGREKGNSQLAIVEETGLIGLLLYCLLLTTVFTKLYWLFKRARESYDKFFLGLIGGSFLGILAQSLFEAWWTSPGVLESLYFWSLVGVIRGSELTQKRTIQAQKTAYKQRITVSHV